jgi:proteasome lid subunit RPN8/RPN11
VKSSAYPPHILDRLRFLAESKPQEEVCGFVVRHSDGALEVAPLRNALGDAEALPGLPEDKRHGYLADPVGHLQLAKRLRLEGGAVVAAYHSHVDSRATFSEVDREFALHDGVPLWPEVDYIVIGLCSGLVSEIRGFAWNGRYFEGVDLPVPGRKDAARHPP